MALKKFVERLTKPVDALDREALTEYCDEHAFDPMDQLVPRRPVRVGGEVRSIRIVPRAGAPALEVTVSDGRGQVVAVFLGRRAIAGLTPGRRIVLHGVVAVQGNRALLFNPAYEILR